MNSGRISVVLGITVSVILSPGQTDSQVVASCKLGSTCDFVWPGLACTCDDLRSLWSRSNLHASQCKVFTVWPPNASLFASSTCRYLRRRIRLTRALEIRDYCYHNFRHIDYYMLRALISLLFTSLIPYRERASLRASERYGMKNE